VAAIRADITPGAGEVREQQRRGAEDAEVAENNTSSVMFLCELCALCASALLLLPN